MTKRPKKPATDPALAAFRALRDKNKAFIPGPKTAAPPMHQKPRPKDRMRRRP
jgi:hypothetical protein